MCNMITVCNLGWATSFAPQPALSPELLPQQSFMNYQAIIFEIQARLNHRRIKLIILLKNFVIYVFI